ncbi:putative spoU rRNA methylase [Mycobacterium xenopi 3993]|nr:putative spoU rRNA methylase [Mycobacterium xenopi 3993]
MSGSGVGPWQGPLPSDPRYDPVLLREGMLATSSTPTATGPARRSLPTSTSGDTRCTLRSKTSATTPISVRWCAPPTRSPSTPCTSWAAALESPRRHGH